MSNLNCIQFSSISLGELHDRKDVDAEGLPPVGPDHRASEVGRPHPDYRQRRRDVDDSRQRITDVNDHAKDDGVEYGSSRNEV